MSLPLRTVRGIPARPAGPIERDLNAVAARDPARERTRPPPLPELAPIPAAVGVAEWGGTQTAGSV